MKPNEERTPSGRPEDSIADQNVERLIEHAYRPEPLDEQFARRVTERLSVEAERSRDAGRNRSVRTADLGSSVGRDDSRTSSRNGTSVRRWPWPALAMGCLAVSLLLAAGATIVWFSRGATGVYRDGPYVWIDGRAYVAAQSDSEAAERRSDPQHRDGPPFRPATAPPVRLVSDVGLTARPRPDAVAPRAVGVGERVATDRGERRRIRLPDGSVLYVDRNSMVEVERPRRVRVLSGTVFVESAEGGSAAGERTGEMSGLVVDTPHGEFTARGTRFAVEVDDERTDVLVTRGRLAVSGTDEPVLAGQRWRGKGTEDATNRSTTYVAARADHELAWTRELRQAELVPAGDHEGGDLVAMDPDGQEMKLALRDYRIDVHVEDGFARTTIDQTYFNHDTRRLEGTFRFPLPPDASISRLAMYVGGKLMEGGMVERNRGRDVFETIKHRSLDPALLEWVDGSTFKMRVFPLEGRQEKRIVLSYTQKLDNGYGRTTYRFPAGDNSRGARRWSFRMHVADGADRDWHCDTHPLRAETGGESLTLTVESDRDSSETSDVLDWHHDVVVSLFDGRAEGGPAAESVRFSSAEHEGARYLMLRYRPELPIERRRARRDWVFLFEADGSRDPLLARAQIEIVRTLLENMEPDDTFAVITAGTRLHALATDPLTVSRENEEQAIRFLERTHLIGALDLGLALSMAGSYVDAMENPVLVHLGGAVPITGERNGDTLLEKLRRRVPYVGVGVGNRWNRGWMRAAASRTSGFFTRINPDEPIGWRAFQLRSILDSPTLLDARVTGTSGDAENGEEESSDVRFLTFQDWVAHGEELCAVARLDADREMPKEIDVHGTVAGQPFHRVLDVRDVSPKAEVLPRMWAKLEIDRLVNLDPERHKPEIISLSKAMYVMSPFTSLLVLENDEMYEQYGVDRGRKDHWALYPCPERIEVVHEPLPIESGLGGLGASHDSPSAGARAKPSVEETLRTLVRLPDRALHGHFGKTDWLKTMTWESLHRADGDRLTFTADPFAGGGESVHRYDFGERRTGVHLDKWTMNEGRELTVADFDSLLGLIASTNRPTTWEIVGGGEIEGFSGNLSLVVSQTQQVHDQPTLAALPSFAVPLHGYSPFFDRPVAFNAPGSVDYILNGVVPDVAVDFDVNGDLDFSSWRESAWSADGRKLVVAPDPRWVRVWSLWNPVPRRYTWTDPATRSAQTSRVLSSLGAVIKVDFDAVPLREALRMLSERNGVRLNLDEQALNDRGIDAETPVTCRYERISLHSVLTLMLHDLDLVPVIEPDGVTVTTVESLNERLVESVPWTEERLLWLGRGRVGPLRSRERAWSVEEFDSRVGALERSVSDARGERNLLYRTPPAVHDPSLFRDLLRFAPGTATSRADVLSTLDREADVEVPTTGEVDDRARSLIEASRSAPWREARYLDDDGRVTCRLRFNGEGSFRCERTTEFGLRETVVCDGEKLRHLYPELGIGTTREVDRFHRRDTRYLMPWIVEPVKDLAIGNDLRLVGPRTVAVVPNSGSDAQAGSEDRVASGSGTETEVSNPRDRSNSTSRRVHLVFAVDGRLTERQVVEMPSAKVLHREVYEIDGDVRWLDEDDRLIDRRRVEFADCDSPDLQPDVAGLVVLPLPARSPEHVLETVANATSETKDDQSSGNALSAVVAGENERRDGTGPAWSEADALRLLASYARWNPEEMRKLIARRWFARGDRRVGFHVLMVSCGLEWNVSEPIALDDGTTVVMNPTADHPESPVARYLADRLSGAEPVWRESTATGDGGSNPGFVERLDRYRYLLHRWSRGDGPPRDIEQRNRELDRLFSFIENRDCPTFSYVLLRKLQRRYGDEQPHARIATALIELEKRSAVCYGVKYELARSLFDTGRKESGANLFRQLYEETTRRGILPPIDRTFREAMEEEVAEGHFLEEPIEKGFVSLVRSAAEYWIRAGRRPTVVALAFQLRQLEIEQEADDLVERVLLDVPADEFADTILSAVAYWTALEKWDLALETLEPLTRRERFASRSSTWRLASTLAGKAGMTARCARHLERASEIDLERMPSRYDVERVRADYRQLLERVGDVIRVAHSPDADGTKDLVDQVVRVADRWRTLDTDVTSACQTASRLLTELGQEELAWDYLTTPLSLKPNESQPWLDLARQLAGERRYDLADRAYGQAFLAEPTNPGILWDQARLLRRAGRDSDARRLCERITEGDWQPRFESVKREAARWIREKE